MGDCRAVVLRGPEHAQPYTQLTTDMRATYAPEAQRIAQAGLTLTLTLFLTLTLTLPLPPTPTPTPTPTLTLNLTPTLNLTRACPSRRRHVASLSSRSTTPLP